MTVLEHKSGRYTFYALCCGMVLAIAGAEISPDIDTAMTIFAFGSACLIITGTIMTWAGIRAWRFYRATGINNMYSAMYWIVTCLAWSINYAFDWQFYGRWLYLNHPDRYAVFAMGYWWQFRNIPELITIMVFAAWSIDREFGRR